MSHLAYSLKSGVGHGTDIMLPGFQDGISTFHAIYKL